MTGQTAIGTLSGEWLFAIPVAVLATLVVLLVRRVLIKRATERRRSAVQAYSAAGVEDDVVSIARSIDLAKAAADKSGLADLYLAMARAYHTLGNESARLDALTSAAACASHYGPEASHALARMQLAEIAYSAGDLTSACEHWHLARGAFQASGQTSEHARVEKLMRDNGCPTDWVLTEF